MTIKKPMIAVVAGVLLAAGVVIAAGAPAVAGGTAKPPTVRQVSPDDGPVAGGTFVTISGSGFDGATAVDFGTTPAPSGWYVRTPGQIEAIAPASSGTGTAVVTVTTPQGTSSATATTTNVYNYVTGPTIQNLSPGVGAAIGGASVTIAGQGFSCPCGVTFGGVAASVTADSSTELTATAPGPESNGTVPVVVTNSDGITTTPADDPAAQFTYAAETPVVNAVTPSTGGAGAGTVVTIVGLHFKKSPKGSTSVDFGSAPATLVKVTGSKIMADVPAGVGTVDVTVTTPNGTSSINEPADEFTYTS